ncbi:hypothetical protein DL93DRAFT_831943 [Clavulina sp. PMI_390]|nr:hypothetical protein DL93DRAFT_831943 [Clavulina sp. PMI_390]
MAFMYDGTPSRPCDYCGCVCRSSVARTWHRAHNATIASTLARYLTFLLLIPLNNSLA